MIWLAVLTIATGFRECWLVDEIKLWLRAGARVLSTIKSFQALFVRCWSLFVCWRKDISHVFLSQTLPRCRPKNCSFVEEVPESCRDGLSFTKLIKRSKVNKFKSFLLYILECRSNFIRVVHKRWLETCFARCQEFYNWWIIEQNFRRSCLYWS